MQKNTEIRGNTMGYKINYEKNIEMQLKSEAIIQECLLTLDTVEDVLNKIKTTEAVKCKAKNALNAYMDDVIINRMIAVTREAIQWYVWEQTCYIYEMYEHDDCETAIIEEEHLEDTKSALEEHYCSIVNRVDTFLRNILIEDRTKPVPNKRIPFHLASDSQEKHEVSGNCRILQCIQKQTDAVHETYGMSSGWFLPVLST